MLWKDLQKCVKLRAQSVSTNKTSFSLQMLVTAVGVNSQTGIIMTLLGAAKSVAEEERKAAKREGKLACLGPESQLMPDIVLSIELVAILLVIPLVRVDSPSFFCSLLSIR